MVRILDLKPGQDGLQKLLDRLDTEKVEEPIQRFWAEVSFRHFFQVVKLIMIDISRTPSWSYCLPTPFLIYTIDRDRNPSSILHPKLQAPAHRFGGSSGILAILFSDLFSSFALQSGGWILCESRSGSTEGDKLFDG